MRLDSIKVHLEVCITFASIVERVYARNREHAERTLGEAEKGYSTVLRLFSQANRLGMETENELKCKLKHLRCGQ
jgi:hypothetical protein